MVRCFGAIAAVMIFTVIGITPVEALHSESQKFPDVVNVDVRADGKNVFDFDVTASSPYDTAERYVGVFRVSRAFGETKLLHDQAYEQPWTRELYGMTIPAGIRAGVAQARDQTYGYGGKAAEVALPGP